MESPSYARQAYTQEIRELEHDLLEMGSIAEAMVGQAVQSLCTMDVELARQVMERDDVIDDMDIAIEQRCIRLFALQHPMASDLRVVSTAMKVITDIERVGDLAVDLAKITLKLEKELGSSGCIDLPRIAGVARAMLHQAMEAFVRRDLALVQAVADSEEVVDELYRQMRGQLFETMRRSHEQVVADGWLLMAIHAIERVADHAVNIAERVAFMVTGVPRHHAERGEFVPRA